MGGEGPGSVKGQWSDDAFQYRGEENGQLFAKTCRVESIHKHSFSSFSFVSFYMKELRMVTEGRL